MYSKQYLLYGGGILIVAGILGLIGVLGPLAEGSIFGSAWFFSTAQSWVNIAIGIIAMLVGYSAEAEGRRWTAGVISIIGGLAGLAGLLMPTTFAGIVGSSPENIIGSLFYLAMGTWGAWSAFSGAEQTGTHGMAHPAT